MNYDEYQMLGSTPYCRCCGSYNVVTEDRLLSETSSEIDTQIFLKDRLWKTLAALSYDQLDEFIHDAFSMVEPEPGSDLQGELSSALRNRASVSPDDMEDFQYSRECHWLSFQRLSDAAALEDIRETQTDELEEQRKLAFMRLWAWWDDETRHRFLVFVDHEMNGKGTKNA